MRSDDTDHLTALYELVGGEIATVALGADAVFRFAGEHRANLDGLDASSGDGSYGCFVDLLSSTYDVLASLGVLDVMDGCTTEDALAEGGDDGTILHHVSHLDASQCATVLLRDDDIVRYIDETTCQITSICRLKCGIG